MPAEKKPSIIIESKKYSLNIDFKELFQYKDLFYIMAYRDLRVRYAQTFLGLLWAIIQPLITLLIFTLIFGRAIKVPTGDYPYSVFALCGMSAWFYFAFVMGQSGNSIIVGQELVKKIYFPRIILPLSKAVTGIVDFVVTLLFLFVFMIYFGITPTSNIVFLPLFIVLLLLTSLGVGILLSSLTIRYRDFQHIVPFLVQLGLYVTPIAYSSSLIPEKYHLFYYLNPMAGIVEGFRWSILNIDKPNEYAFLSYGVGIVIFVISLIYFKKIERIMADIV